MGGEGVCDPYPESSGLKLSGLQRGIEGPLRPLDEEEEEEGGGEPTALLGLVKAPALALSEKKSVPKATLGRPLLDDRGLKAADVAEAVGILSGGGGGDIESLVALALVAGECASAAIAVAAAEAADIDARSTRSDSAKPEGF